ncbi:MAG: tetratricopeptide repeat protein [Anaerolineae bacterium]|jgi:regulator of sirC expression with transglutaminase-like and TPR domain
MYPWNWLWSRFLRRLADAHRHFGNQYGNRQEYRAAVGNYSRAIHLDPGYTEALYSRGVLFWRELGQYESAIQDLTRVLQLDPSWAMAYLNRGLAFKMQQDYQSATADFERFLEKGQDEFWLEAASRQLVELREEMGDGTGS